jgi:phage shock protein A
LPWRLRSLYGAARAAELAGDLALARHFAQELRTLTQGADGTRAELEELRSHLGMVQ